MVIERDAVPGRDFRGRFDFNAPPEWRDPVRVIVATARGARDIEAWNTCAPRTDQFIDAAHAPRAGYGCAVHFGGTFPQDARSLSITTLATADLVGELRLDVR